MKVFIRLLSVSTLLFLVSLTNTADAQKVNLYEGNLNFLKGQTMLNVKYDYSNMSVGDFEKEQDYLDEKIKEKNKEEAGSGDVWAKKWVADRKERFQPKFEELMNDHLGKKGVSLDSLGNAKYTIILKTTHTEPGYNVGVWRRPAAINVDIWFVEAANEANVLAKIKMEKVPGQDAWGFDFDTGYRLQESYAKCGKSLAGYLLKKAL